MILPPPSARSARALRPRWRDLLFRVWGVDPLLCPHCKKGTMKVVDKKVRPEEIEFFLRLLGLWEGVIAEAVSKWPRTALTKYENFSFDDG